jgi:uncharacterized phage infection (PIP) family protein YhgE
MTSLTETLPILDEAVPALPRKVEEVAREGDSFEQAARQTLAVFEQRRADAKGLAEQVRHALEILEEQANQDRQQVEQAVQGLDGTAEESRTAARDGADDLETGGEAATAAFTALTTHLTQGGDRTRAAHDDARQALDTADDRAQSTQSELDGLVDRMTAAITAAEHALEDEQAKVAAGVTALSQALGNLLEQARTRLGETRSQLDELHSNQEAAVRVALAELTEGREKLEQQLGERLQKEVQQGLNDELEAVSSALGDLGEQVVRLEADCQAEREGLDPQLDAVAQMLGPLQNGVEQVHKAADQVGIVWP